MIRVHFEGGWFIEKNQEELVSPRKLSEFGYIFIINRQKQTMRRVIGCTKVQ